MNHEQKKNAFYINEHNFRGLWISAECVGIFFKFAQNFIFFILRI